MWWACGVAAHVNLGGLGASKPLQGSTKTCVEPPASRPYNGLSQQFQALLRATASGDTRAMRTLALRCGAELAGSRAYNNEGNLLGALRDLQCLVYSDSFLQCYVHCLAAPRQPTDVAVTLWVGIRNCHGE